MLTFQRVTIANCAAARQAVVVIDVLRAFSTAAYALARGAQEILLTGTVEEAFALRARFPGALLMGEVGGLPIPGFDFSNSPAQVQQAELAGRRLVQRTTRGTQGVVLSKGAQWLFASSFVCAAATARQVRQSGASQVTFVISGADLSQRFGPPGSPIGVGDEDLACADYLQALLCDANPDPAPYLERVLAAPASNKFVDPEQVDFLPDDLALCMTLDRFDFAMPVQREQDLLRLERR